MKLPQNDSAVGRGLKTFVQAVVGLLVGLIVTVWAVPGVPHAVIGYLQTHVVELALLVGIPSGVTSLIWNLFRKNVPNY